MLELAIWLHYIGIPDLAVRIVADAATAIFLLWGILNYYDKKEVQESFLEVSRSARYWKMVSEYRWTMIKELMERLHKWNGRD